MRKVIALFLSIIFCLSLSGCTRQNEKTEQATSRYTSTAISKFNIPEDSEQLPEYDSRYTACFKNADESYSLYISASPIQYYSDGIFIIIDNSIISSSVPNYVFENKSSNIKMYFPSMLTENFMMASSYQQFEFKPTFDVTDFTSAEYQRYENMYGDIVDAVVYKSDDLLLAFYAANLGIKAEMVFYKKPKESNFQFAVLAPDTTCENKNNGYITFVTSDATISSTIYAPIMKGSKENYNEKSNNISINSELGITTKDYKNYLVDFNLDKDFLNSDSTKYPVHCDLTFQMYDHAAADSAVYENILKNHYLQQYAVIGNEPTRGEAWLFMRTRLKYFMKIDPDFVLSASYNHRELSGFKGTFNVSYDKPNGQWSSSQMIWYSKSEKLDSVNKTILNNQNELSGDITDYAKYQLVQDTSVEESYGLIISSSNIDKYRIIATSDNALYAPYLEWMLSELPEKFYPQQRINPD